MGMLSMSTFLTMFPILAVNTPRHRARHIDKVQLLYLKSFKMSSLPSEKMMPNPMSIMIHAP